MQSVIIIVLSCSAKKVHSRCTGKYKILLVVVEKLSFRG